MTLSDSEPQPDIAVVRWRDDFYGTGHPTLPDIYWLVEVADSGIAYDQQVKVPLYLDAGIPEVWLVHLEAQRVEVYRQGTEPIIVYCGQFLSSLTFPDLVFSADDLLNPPVH
ncbi:MAG: Uma2 family endonuclease [Gloeomargarita sp. SKYBB_i_bin120]|nr:Uma2 family endonuclease [Gloeomargarita sp. SKYBB_i_bin120]